MSNFDESKVNRQRDGKFGFKCADEPASCLQNMTHFEKIHLIKDGNNTQQECFA